MRSLFLPKKRGGFISYYDDLRPVCRTWRGWRRRPAARAAPPRTRPLRLRPREPVGGIVTACFSMRCHTLQQQLPHLRMRRQSLHVLAAALCSRCRHLVLVLGGIYGSIVQRGVLRCGRGGRVSPPRTPRQTLHDRRRRRRLRWPPPGLVAVGTFFSFFPRRCPAPSRPRRSGRIRT